MGHPAFTRDPVHWLERAQEARSLAEQMHTEDAREKMLDIAETYEELAQRSTAELQQLALNSAASA